MRKSIQSSAIGLALVLALLIFSPGLSHAISIGFNPVHQEVALGAQAEVEIVISDLGSFGPETLAAYDFSVLFDPTILSVLDVTFGDPLLGDQLEFWFPSDQQYVLGGVYPDGEVNLVGVSLDPNFVLDMNQADEFVLATITFDTLLAGTSDLDIITPRDSSSGDLNPEGPYFGGTGQGLYDVERLVPTLGDGSITVRDDGTQPIPEPGTIFLLGSGLLGIAGLRRKFS